MVAVEDSGETSAEPPAIEVIGVTYRYGERLAIDALSFTVGTGEIYGLLGPNGGGKTTLFELLSSLRPLQSGRVRVFGHDLGRAAIEVRKRSGVAFQAPSLDVHLTVYENLRHQGHLYGLKGDRLARRIGELLERFDLTDRSRDRVSILSGGLKRRLEISRALVHEPQLLLLDEPSSGLDPGIRRDLWSLLEELRRRDGVTVLLTTHFMEEGDRCDRVGLLDRGRLVAEGEPATLEASVGGDVVTIGTDVPEEVCRVLLDRFGLEAWVGADEVRFERHRAHEEVVAVVEALADRIRSIKVSQPTLEDVFLKRTGRSFWEGET